MPLAGVVAQGSTVGAVAVKGVVPRGQNAAPQEAVGLTGAEIVIGAQAENAENVAFGDCDDLDGTGSVR